MKNIIAYLVILLVFINNTCHAQGNKIEKYVLELLPEKIAENSYDDLFWSKCLGAADKLSSKEIGAKISALINDEPSRIAFYKRVNYYLSSYEPLYSFFYVYRDIAISKALEKELKDKALYNNVGKKDRSIFIKADMDDYIKYVISFQQDDVLNAKCSPTDDEKVYQVVEYSAQFRGGDEKMMIFLRDVITYPQFEKDNDIQGKAVVAFTVCEDGTLSDIKVIKKISPGLDAEALRVVKLMPKFEPAKHKGKALKFYYTLPIVFKLQ